MPLAKPLFLFLVERAVLALFRSDVILTKCRYLIAGFTTANKLFERQNKTAVISKNILRVSNLDRKSCAKLGEVLMVMGFLWLIYRLFKCYCVNKMEMYDCARAFEKGRTFLRTTEVGLNAN